MTEIPEDVMKAAKEIAEIANNCCYRSDGYEEDIADRIARAILAERERCCSVLRRLHEQQDGETFCSIFIEIEEIIRKGV